MDKTAGFRTRLLSVFDNASMAEVARRLKIPHATVRNYYKGRLPATEVLVKIADETGVSLNWLLLGRGEMYASRNPRVSIEGFLEAKIREMIVEQLGPADRTDIVNLGSIDSDVAFDVAAALQRSDDPRAIMSDWFRHEGRESPADFGVVFFRGWETFAPEQKVAALNDARRVLDRVLKPK